MNTKVILARSTWESKNAMTITSYAEEKDQLIVDTVFIKFFQKITNSQYISMQISLFDLRILINIINQVIGVVKIIQEKNKLNKSNNKEILPLEYTSSDNIITNKSTNKNEQKTITIAFVKSTLYINCFYKDNKISLGFKKIEIEPLLASLLFFVEESTKNFYLQLNRVKK